MTTSAVTVLNRRRGNLKGQITKLSTSIVEEETHNSVVAKLDSLTRIQQKFEELKLEYYGIVTDEQFDETERFLAEMDEELYNLEVSLKSLLSEFQTKTISVSNNPVNENRSVNTSVKLPEIPLPKFGGQLEEWFLFKSQFLTIIESNKNLSDSQKLYYLQSSLFGTAKQVQTQDDAYTSLWNALVQRFENKRLIVNSHVNVLLTLDKIKYESAKDLRILLDKCLKHLRALKSLELELNPLTEIILINIIVQKLDSETRKLYEMTLASTEIPTWETFIEYLQKRCLILENMSNATQASSQKHLNRSKSFLVSSNLESNLCQLCKQSHQIQNCTLFKEMNTKLRFEAVKKHRLCINCLQRFHKASECTSNFSCKICRKKHSSLLHFHKQSTAPGAVVSSQNTGSESNENKIAEEVPSVITATSIFPSKSKQVILSTAIIYVTDSFGNKIPGRALLDNGSMSNFISHSFAQRLNLKSKQINVLVSALNGTGLTVKSETKANISNINGEFQRSLELLIVPKITDICPSKCLDISKLPLPKNIVLADPQFFRPSKIDILIGAEIFFELLNMNKVVIENSQLSLQDTVFGYIISGCINNVNVPSENTQYCGLVLEEDLNQTIKNFWELENVEPEYKNKEAAICEDHFVKTYYKDPSGKYVVSIPFREDPICLGESKRIALKRLNSLWKRLGRDSEYLSLYRDFLREYETLGHMTEIMEEKEPDLNYYMPHHGVYRPDKTTTKLRVVFNASTLTTAGNSLNSLQLNGGVIQEDLFSIMNRFRKHQFAFTADIEKMFRMVFIHPDQRPLQRILWKDSMNSPVKIFELNTVTYGTVSAPFLAMRTLKQLSIDEEKNFPLAAPVILEDLYMDDVLSGAESLQEAKELQRQLCEILKKGGMNLRKWHTNNAELSKNSIIEQDYSFNYTEEIKALGIIWKPNKDCFSFKVSLDLNTRYTKRAVLSTIARLFDPLGLLGPVLAKAKIFIQKLWLLKIDWDDILPVKEAQEWGRFVASLQNINIMNISRCVLPKNSIEVEVHGFADASEAAYGAVVYIKAISASSDVSVKLLCSKSRVAPLKSTTIPRLELCAATLLAKLLKRVLSSLKTSISSVHMWTDSTIVLAWIQHEPHTLKTFVANRVAVIQELSSTHQWHHVPSEENPADLISRGTDPEGLRDNKLWWDGPAFLLHDLSSRVDNSCAKDVKVPELKKLPDSSLTFTITLDNDLLSRVIERSNSFSKIVYIFSFICRFVSNLRKNDEDRLRGPLLASELNSARYFIVREIQAKEFGSEIALISAGKPVIKGKVSNLRPFLDSNNILRVGGRLQNSNLSFDTKHPILLPATHKFTKIVMNYYHRKYLHVGAQNLLHLVRQEYWPLNGRNIARQIVHSCVVCFKQKPVVETQLMGNLPPERINPSPPFNVTGIDFCGPFFVKFKGQRKGIYHKVYVSIFVCFVTKAVHLETVTDLTSEAFIAALKRFFSRRGKSASIFTDNATNFVGANSELKRLYNLVKKPEENLASYLASESIAWNFIPPRAPNFGGLWEAGVKAFKYHLKRTIGDHKLTLEEFQTVAIQIEGILNSRPLIPMSSDVDNLEVLTPSHFLVGRALNTIPEPSIISKSDNLLTKWQKTTKMVQIIWKKWHISYLNHLQNRTKWHIEKQNLQPGLMVLIKEDHLPPCKWMIGRIQEVILGPDNKARVVLVKTTHGTFKRSIRSVCVLPNQDG